MPGPIGLPEAFGSVLRDMELSRTTESVGRIGQSTPEIPSIDAPTDGQGVDFSGRVREFFESVNEQQISTTDKVESFANGTNHDLHGTMISLQKADISLRLLSGMRNRVLEAYKEIQRMGA